MRNRFLLQGMLFCFLFSVTSCIPYKDLVLFRKDEAPLQDMQPISTPKTFDLAIQPNDALSITVSSLDPQLAVPFNLLDMRSAGLIQNNSPFISFLVDTNGEIDYPVLGKLQVAKLTIPQLRDTLVKKIKPYIKEPSINIKRVNFKITVIGEVVKPGSFEVSSERITVLEALGLAGDLTPHSDRQRIMVVREENGKVITRKLDLQSPDFFNSPFYYLHQNDVVYVDPKKSKKGAVTDRANKFVNWGSAGVSAIAAVLTVILLLKK
jgi:polysaccharide biosynthesis/export protein